MKNKELFEALRLLSKDKNIPMDALCDGIQHAIVTAVKSDYDNKDIVTCELDQEKMTMRVFVRKNVVSEISDPVCDILPEQAQNYKLGAIPGDIVEIELDTKAVSRIAADKGKHVMRQGIRGAEHDKLKEEFQSRNQEIVTAKVNKVDPVSGTAYIEIGRIEVPLPKGEQIPGENIKAGDIIKVFVADIDVDSKNPRANVSRTHPGLVKRLFEGEVPEIGDGTVEIKSVSREAGSRTKIAVYSADANVDPVGACIGPRGARVGKIVDLLGGEKIDIIKYSENPAEFVASALAPADVVSVDAQETEEERICRVIVPDSQLSLAIGNKGQNARLAAKLTGWKIDINPESGATEPAIVLE